MEDPDSAKPGQSRITVHSLHHVPPCAPVLANHAAYAGDRGYSLAAHELGPCVQLGPMRLLRKYALIRRILDRSAPGDIHVFAEDCLVFSQSVEVERFLGPAEFWLCEDGHFRGRGNGSLILARAGAEAVGRIDAILAACHGPGPVQAAPLLDQNRELIGCHSVGHDELTDGLYPNLLFPSFGYALPGIRAWSVTFNPHVLPHTQDAWSNEKAIEHLTASLIGRKPPFDFPPMKPDSSLAQLTLDGRLSRAGLVLLIEAGQEDVAAMVEDNLRTYALNKGYGLRVVQGRDEGRRLPALLRAAGEALGHHEFVMAVTADVLVHDFGYALPGLFGEASLVLARSAGSGEIDDGFVGLKRSPAATRLLAAVGEGTDDGPWQELLAAMRREHQVRIADLEDFAAHPALRSPVTAILRYHALAPNVRQLAMASDFECLPAQLLPPLPPPPLRTSLSFLRGKRLNRIVMTLIVAAILLTIVKEWA